MDDKEIREKVLKRMNGYYATVICRNCLSFKTHPQGNTETAKMVDTCQHCCECCSEWRKG